MRSERAASQWAPHPAVTSDGLTLTAWRHGGGSSSPAVLLLHAMFVDSRTMDHRGAGLGATLAAEGLDVWRADLRGRGSAPIRAWTYDDLVRRDLPALVDTVAERAGRPVVVVGHSLGGHVALAAVGERRVTVAGLVLVGANIWRPSHEPERAIRLRKSATMAVFSTLAHAGGRFPARRLGLGTADEAVGYVDDLARFWRTDAWTSRDGFDWAAALPTVTTPTLSVAGAGDYPEARPHCARRFVDPVPGATSWVVGRGSGLGFDPGHMALVTDPRCAPWWRAAAGWIRGRSRSTT
jgi:pimeloyl-ACP methyl ester carboxylesterase